MPTPTPNDPNVPKLANVLCFAIYSANLAYGRAYKPILDELGLTYTQFIAIIALWEEDDQSVGSLGEKLFLESNTLTPILKKLEALGYVRRRRDPADERQVPMNLVAAAGLGEDFPVVQKAVVRLRENLLRAVRGQGAKAVEVAEAE